MRLILASTSPYRRKLLARLGIPFDQVAPRVDEDAVKRTGLPPRALAERLAWEKAQDVLEREPDAVVIGSDQVVALAGKSLGKPGDEGRALAQLASMGGREHELVTAVAIVSRRGELRHTDITRLKMRALGEPALRRYLAVDKPFDCAGSYKIEGLGISLFDEIRTDDATAIEGLPLLAVCRGLRELGIDLP